MLLVSYIPRLSDHLASAILINPDQSVEAYTANAIYLNQLY